jgi:hypothetical protein
MKLPIQLPKAETDFNFSLEDAEKYVQGLKDFAQAPYELNKDSIEFRQDPLTINQLRAIWDEIKEWESHIRIIKITNQINK